MSLMVADPQMIWTGSPPRRGVLRSIRDVLDPSPTPDRPPGLLADRDILAPVTVPPQGRPGRQGPGLVTIALRAVLVALVASWQVARPFASMSSVGLGLFVVAGFAAHPIAGWVVAGCAALLAEVEADRRRG
jgi:hypothetical protein